MVHSVGELHLSSCLYVQLLVWEQTNVTKFKGKERNSTKSHHIFISRPFDEHLQLLGSDCRVRFILCQVGSSYISNMYSTFNQEPYIFTSVV